ncbi:hypothetical protein LSG25_10765 [Paralcaligenes sp. KSB-10]|uniref:hypothetical protein n=1 Tax=Paralcaligenes sp. KSB-10 TaxID=2901142 RepID=UPI001E56BA26|nr:hypothetical protein [Paralcaligenes sp. KSB-10]UHL62579.1 hypothetical protein LSG25_10765 [Paralcaligenes sp. KSB-10]
MNARAQRSQQELRIEMLRARAALERQALRRHAREVGESLKPASLLHGILPAVSNKSVNWLLQGLTLTRRYPLLLTGVSALLSGRRRGRNWLRLGAGVLLGWQVVRSMMPADSKRAKKS